MGKKGKNVTKNVERPLSQQELALLQTQNAQLQKGIAIANEQDKRSADQYNLWKQNYLPMEVQMGGVARDPAADKQYQQQLDNQMPKYAQDTSGARGPAATKGGA